MSIVHEIDGIKVVLCTPHDVIFRNKAGEDVVVKQSGYTFKADAVNTVVATYENGLTFVTAQFVASEEGTKEIDELEALYPEVDVFVGSIISAQAFPGRVVAMIPTDDTVRGSVQDKRYRADKFTIFS